MKVPLLIAILIVFPTVIKLMALLFCEKEGK